MLPLVTDVVLPVFVLMLARGVVLPTVPPRTIVPGPLNVSAAAPLIVPSIVNTSALLDVLMVRFAADPAKMILFIIVVVPAPFKVALSFSVREEVLVNVADKLRSRLPDVTVIAPLVPKAPVAFALSMPVALFIVIPPVFVLSPINDKVPAPLIVSKPEPEILLSAFVPA